MDQSNITANIVQDNFNSNTIATDNNNPQPNLFYNKFLNQIERQITVYETTNTSATNSTGPSPFRNITYKEKRGHEVLTKEEIELEEKSEKQVHKRHEKLQKYLHHTQLQKKQKAFEETDYYRKKMKLILMDFLKEHSELTKTFLSVYHQASILFNQGNKKDTGTERGFFKLLKQMKDITEEFVKLEIKSKRIMSVVQKHQENQKKIVKLQKANQVEQESIIHIVATLQNSKQTIQQLILDLNTQANYFKQSQKRQNYDPEDLINYANRIRKFTAAPSNYNPNAAVTHVHAVPPYPDEVKIRSGLLMEMTYDATLPKNQIKVSENEKIKSDGSDNEDNLGESIQGDIKREEESSSSDDGFGNVFYPTENKDKFEDNEYSDDGF
ncbi:hypothetical protein K502DRAFT_339269 [Neoconidiobolus thromboides FSU 785]|nr:hypothetical protein K502DRAFT_339269 [Neoconidiobolus thromboides FSU 785]